MPRLVVVRLQRVVLLLALLVVTGLLAGSHLSRWVQQVAAEKAGLSSDLEAVFYDRASALTTGEAASLDHSYDLTRQSGRYAYAHEVARRKMTQDWLRKRKVHVTHVESDLRIISARVEGDRAQASVCQHLFLTYHHEADSSAGDNLMGTRTIHWLELVRREGRWLIQRDWFWDPFKDDEATLTDVPDLTRGAPYATPPRRQASSTLTGPRRAGFNRAAAVAYADRYCGVRVANGDGRYNLRYRDFTSVGGDCTNFISQVLGDPEAGAIPQDWVWSSSALTASQAWVRAEALVAYLLGSGRATLLARGALQAVAEPTPECPDGPVFSLEPGDVIAYEKEGRIEHLCVVVGKDASGYPVVDSHSGDRYHLPWDLGHHRRTKYWLLRIVY